MSKTKWVVEEISTWKAPFSYINSLLAKEKDLIMRQNTGYPICDYLRFKIWISFLKKETHIKRTHVFSFHGSIKGILWLPKISIFLSTPLRMQKNIYILECQILGILWDPRFNDVILINQMIPPRLENKFKFASKYLSHKLALIYHMHTSPWLFQPLLFFVHPMSEDVEFHIPVKVITLRKLLIFNHHHLKRNL